MLLCSFTIPFFLLCRNHRFKNDSELVLAIVCLLCTCRVCPRVWNPRNPHPGKQLSHFSFSVYLIFYLFFFYFTSLYDNVFNHSGRGSPEFIYFRNFPHLNDFVCYVDMTKRHASSILVNMHKLK